MILPALIAAPLLLSIPCHAADDGKPAKTPVAVVDFSYADTSGEVRDQRREHAARLDAFMTALRSDLVAHGRTVVTPTCNPAPCSGAQPPEGALRAAAKPAQASCSSAVSTR